MLWQNKYLWLFSSVLRRIRFEDPICDELMDFAFGFNSQLIQSCSNESRYEVVKSFFPLLITIFCMWLRYVLQPSVRTRKSNGTTEDATFDGLLKYFSNNTNTKNIIRKIGSEVAQLLLAHAFQVIIVVVLIGSIR